MSIKHSIEKLKEKIMEEDPEFKEKIMNCRYGTDEKFRDLLDKEVQRIRNDPNSGWNQLKRMVKKDG